mmetsp:Transcript_27385/g.70896  ORF Transcript_27385/g.70896 Transcript_27385/m.70896 type:complete len:489 (+) Transcript_27385:109-1575(+)
MVDRVELMPNHTIFKEQTYNRIGYAVKKRKFYGVYERDAKIFRVEDGTMIQITERNGTFQWQTNEGKLMRGKSEVQSDDQGRPGAAAADAAPPAAPRLQPALPPAPVIGRRIEPNNSSESSIKFHIEDINIERDAQWSFELRLWKSASSNNEPLPRELDLNQSMPDQPLRTEPHTNIAPFEINGLDPDTVYIFEVRATLSRTGTGAGHTYLLQAKGGKGRRKSQRCWNKTGSMQVPTVQIQDGTKRGAWRQFFGCTIQDPQSYAVCLVSCDRHILAYNPEDDSQKWDAGHIIAGSFGGADHLVRLINLIPEYPSTNRSHKAQNLIDYMVKNQPRHLHEIACRLKLAYGNLCPGALDSLEFIWRVYHDGEGLGDSWDKSKGQIQTSYRDLRRAILTPPEDGKVRLEEADMVDFIKNKFELLKTGWVYWEARTDNNPSVWPEDYFLATDDEAATFERWQQDQDTDPRTWKFFIFTLGRHRIKCQRPDIAP